MSKLETYQDGYKEGFNKAVRDFYKELDKLHSLAFEIDSSKMVNAIAKAKLSLNSLLK